MSEEALNDEERREFFRISGEVYLYVQAVEDNGDVFNAEPNKEYMDPIALRLMHYQGKLEYEASNDLANVKELIAILRDMYSSLIGDSADLPRFNRQDVVISGGGFEFTSDENYDEGAILQCYLSFPGYPFETVTVQSRVVHCEGAGDSFNIGTVYDDISEGTRDTIIKFVNELQREQTRDEASNLGG